MIPTCRLCGHQHWPGLAHVFDDEPVPTVIEELAQSAVDQSKGAAQSQRMREYWRKRKAAVDQSSPSHTPDTPEK